MKNNDSMTKCNALCSGSPRSRIKTVWHTSITKWIKAASNPISGDKKTITIKPLEMPDGTKLYPNAVGISGTGTNLAAPILSEIVLTKGWNGPKSQAKPSSAERLSPVLHGVESAQLKMVRKSMTKFNETKTLKSEIKVINEKALNEGMEKVAEKYFNIKK